MSRSTVLILLAAIALIAAMVVVYWPCLHGQPIFDDTILITDNRSLHNASGLARIWTDPKASQDFYPLTFTLWWAGWQLWGENVLGFHVLTLALHIINALLLWRLLTIHAFHRLGTAATWAGLFSAAIFALHPVHAESVAWMSQLKNTLSVCLSLLCALAFMRAMREPLPALLGGPHTLDPEAPTDVRHASSKAAFAYWYGLAIGLFVLSLLAKPVAMTPAAVLPLLVCWKRGRITARTIRPAVPLLVLCIPMAWLTMRLQVDQIGTQGPAFEHSVAERILIAGRVLAFYAGKLVWPHPVSFAYSRWIVDVSQAWQWLYPAGCAVVVAALWFARRHIGLGPFLAAAAFIIMLSPALGFIDIYWHLFYFVADHVQYMASAAVIATVIGLVAHTALGLPRMGRIAIVVLGVLIAGWLGVLTRAQARLYKDQFTMWSAVIAADPDSALAWGNLGNVFLSEHKTEDAERAYRRSIEIIESTAVREPGFLFQKNYPEAHSNLGVALLRQNRMHEAAAAFRTAENLATRFAADLVDLSIAINNYAWILATTPDETLADGEAAVMYAARALQTKDGATPGNLDTLACALARAGRYEEAERTARAAAVAARAEGQTGMAAEIERHADAFAHGRPWIETPP